MQMLNQHKAPSFLFIFRNKTEFTTQLALKVFEEFLVAERSEIHIY